MTTTTISLDDNEIQLHTLTGNLITGRVKTILWDAEMPSCIMFLVIESSLWSRVWGEKLFQLSLEVADHDPTDFDQSEEIEIELALIPNILNQLIAIPESIPALLHGLGGTKPDFSVLAHCTSWIARSVVQEVLVPSDPDSKLQMGFKTLWGQNAQSIAVKNSENVSDNLWELVKSVFEEQNWQYELTDSNYFSTSIAYQTYQWSLVVNVDLEKDFCLVYSIFPEDITSEKRTLVAQKVAYFNYDLYLGNWEIDLEDGELRLRTSIDSAGTKIDRRLIKQLILANIQIMGQSMQKIYELI